MKKVRYAVVGAGWISQEAFMPAIAQTGNSEITAIVSGSADVARKLADFHGVPHIFTYDQYDKMLAADLGTTPEKLSLALARLQSLDLLRVQRRAFIIPAPDRLRQTTL